MMGYGVGPQRGVFTTAAVNGLFGAARYGWLGEAEAIAEWIRWRVESGRTVIVGHSGEVIVIGPDAADVADVVEVGDWVLWSGREIVALDDRRFRRLFRPYAEPGLAGAGVFATWPPASAAVHSEPARDSGIAAGWSDAPGWPDAQGLSGSGGTVRSETPAPYYAGPRDPDVDAVFARVELELDAYQFQGRFRKGEEGLRRRIREAFYRPEDRQPGEKVD